MDDAAPGGVFAGDDPGRDSPDDSPPDRVECTPFTCAGPMTPASGSGGTAMVPVSGGGGSSSIGGGLAGNAGVGGASGESAPGGEAGSPASGGSSGAPPLIEPPSYPLLPRALPGATTIVSDPLRDRLYVAIGADAPAYASSVVAFDPSAGVVSAVLPVGATPDSLAVSDDGTTLWVGLHDSSSVLKADVSGDVPVAVVQYALPPSDSPPYPHHAGPMVVLPGTTSSLAVSLHYDGLSPSLAGVVVLDEGVARPRRLPSHTGASRLTRGPDGFLFGFNNLHGGFGLYSISVDSDGLAQTEHLNLVSGFDTDIVSDRGMLFATDGAIIGLGNPEYPIPLGQLPVAGQVFPDVVVNVVWVLQGPTSEYDPTPPALILVNLPTLEVIDTNYYGTPTVRPRHFVRSRSGVFAYVADYFDDEAGVASGIHWMRP